MPPPLSSQSGKIIIGTASWSDPGFIARWYPAKMAAADRLPWYAGHFEMVEVNSSFYAVPDRRLVARWSRATPAEFVFDLKLHRLLSRHSATLQSLPPALQRLAKADARGRVVLTPAIEQALLEAIRVAVEPLRESNKLGKFLLQLSPAFSPRKHEFSELDDLFGLLGAADLVVELRNRHWLEAPARADTVDFFRRRKVARALVDAPTEAHFTIMPSDFDKMTRADLAYLRLHGRNADAYVRGKTVAERFYYNYSDAEIEEVAERARRLSRDGASVHVVFNNNALDFAPHAALRLRAALGQIARGPARQPDLFG